jgi:hypothetical protein
MLTKCVNHAILGVLMCWDASGNVSLSLVFETGTPDVAQTLDLESSSVYERAWLQICILKNF